MEFRFIHQTKKDMKMDGVNEDDLLEIKQDISSLRWAFDFKLANIYYYPELICL